MHGAQVLLAHKWCSFGEPPENDNPLLKNNKVYLSPHTAAFTDECMTRMGVETIQNIIDYFDDTLEKSKIVRL